MGIERRTLLLLASLSNIDCFLGVFVCVCVAPGQKKFTHRNSVRAKELLSPRLLYRVDLMIPSCHNSALVVLSWDVLLQCSSASDVIVRRRRGDTPEGSLVV